MTGNLYIYICVCVCIADPHICNINIYIYIYIYIGNQKKIHSGKSKNPITNIYENNAHIRQHLHIICVLNYIVRCAVPSLY